MFVLAYPASVLLVRILHLTGISAEIERGIMQWRVSHVESHFIQNKGKDFKTNKPDSWPRAKKQNKLTRRSKKKKSFYS